MPLASVTITTSLDANGFAIGEFGISAGPISSISLLGMGDSYSSGESVPPYSDPDGCHRSTRAYAPLLAQANNWNLADFTACTGATSLDFTFRGQHGEQAQLAQLQTDRANGLHPDGIMLTLGGDDIGFKSIIEYCIEERIAGLDPLNFTRFGGSCSDDPNFAPVTQDTIENEYAPLVETFRRLVATAGPDVSIMAADYPQIFPPNADQQTCIELRPYFTKDDQSWFRLLTAILDNKELQAARDAGINGVNVLDEFTGHAICDSDGAWLNGVTNINGWDDPTGSFHPTANGQIGYARAFANYINSAISAGTPLTSAGLPADPSDPPADNTSNTLQLTLGSLTVTPPVNQPDCTDVVQGGEQVTVTGDGYAPGAKVSLDLIDSDKAGDAQHVALGTLTADSNGAVNTTVRLPLGMAGIVPPETSGSLAYLQTLGTGATAANQLDNELVNVAPHGNACGVVSALPFQGFDPPVANYPAVNAAQPGSTVPVKFTMTGVPGTIGDALAPGYPQSAPVSCSNPAALTSGDATSSTSLASRGGQSDHYNYAWATDRSWTGCRELIVQVADGGYHQAVFNFSKK